MKTTSSNSGRALLPRRPISSDPGNSVAPASRGLTWASGPRFVWSLFAAASLLLFCLLGALLACDRLDRWCAARLTDTDGQEEEI